MKIQAKISIAFNCENCGERCETETDFPWLDETSVFKCDFCGAISKIQMIQIEEKNDERKTLSRADND